MRRTDAAAADGRGIKGCMCVRSHRHCLPSPPLALLSPPLPPPLPSSCPPLPSPPLPPLSCLPQSPHAAPAAAGCSHTGHRGLRRYVTQRRSPRSYAPPPHGCAKQGNDAVSKPLLRCVPTHDPAATADQPPCHYEHAFCVRIAGAVQRLCYK